MGDYDDDDGLGRKKEREGQGWMDRWGDRGNVHGYREATKKRKMGKDQEERKKEKKRLEQPHARTMIV